MLYYNIVILHHRAIENGVDVESPDRMNTATIYSSHECSAYGCLFAWGMHGTHIRPQDHGHSWKFQAVYTIIHYNHIDSANLCDAHTHTQSRRPRRTWQYLRKHSPKGQVERTILIVHNSYEIHISTVRFLVCVRRRPPKQHIQNIQIHAYACKARKIMWVG